MLFPNVPQDLEFVALALVWDITFKLNTTLGKLEHLQSQLCYAVILTVYDLHILAFTTKPSLGTMKYFKRAGSVQCNDYIIIHS
jgi:hypothetical protein